MDAEVALEPDREPGMHLFEVEEHGGVWDDDDEVPVEEVSTAGLLAPSLSEDEVLAFLDRDAEVQLAKQPGQGRREGIQNMRQVAGERRRGTGEATVELSPPALWREQALPNLPLGGSAERKAGGNI